ncbi:MAG: hypothetical protein ACTHJ4_00610, partial [Candidatus Nucleicultricaceae bacterium]
VSGSYPRSTRTFRKAMDHHFQCGPLDSLSISAIDAVSLNNRVIVGQIKHRRTDGERFGTTNTYGFRATLPSYTVE